MDITSSIFWQNAVIIVLLVPYAIAICFSTYYARKQRRSAANKPRPSSPARAE
ncbi:MAG TPA: hypothetical protein VH933_08545 [Aestuariivirgaceae bacterium]|jgi:hypothetical protein